MVLMVSASGQSRTNAVLKVEPGSRSSSSMLQLKSGGYAVGFLPDRAYLVTGGHALTVEFLGTPGVMPRIQANPDPLSGAARKVFYEDLWPGVGLTFSLSPNGSCDATYILDPGAQVSKIRLRYNIPVRLQSDGTLKFRFSSGSVTESSPEAWQEIGGRRVPVSVSFLLDRGEAGFALGGYDPRFAVTIDPTYEPLAADAFTLVPGQLQGVRSSVSTISAIIPVPDLKGALCVLVHCLSFSPLH
jgi:hypothetical protein